MLADPSQKRDVSWGWRRDGFCDAGWRGQLHIAYSLDGERTTAHDRHEGPLRVLKRLYPEGPGICHHVLVHPPGGVVGGDMLHLEAHLATGTHAVLTTPGATRFYRSAGAPALQDSVFHVAGGARLEWLPMEAIAHRGCIAENRVTLHLEPGAECIGWDLLALGLPASGEPFDHGSFRQHIELPGQWLERGVVDAADTLLLDSPLGLAGQRVLCTLWFAAGSPLPAARRDALLDAARSLATDSPLARTAGATCTHAGVVVLRVLAQRMESAMALLAAVRAAWRAQAWQLQAHPPRIWRT
jgi:urease accessory protein